MNRLSLFLFVAVMFVAVLFIAVMGHAAEKPVHLFILSGQSNMAGMNPKIGFQPEAKKLFPDADVVYIKIAQGGQPIRLWSSTHATLTKGLCLNSSPISRTTPRK